MNSRSFLPLVVRMTPSLMVVVIPNVVRDLILLGNGGAKWIQREPQA